MRTYDDYKIARDSLMKVNDVIELLMMMAIHYVDTEHL